MQRSGTAVVKKNFYSAWDAHITGTLAARDGVAIEMIRLKLRDLYGKDGKTYYNREGYFALICTSLL